MFEHTLVEISGSKQDDTNKFEKDIQQTMTDFGRGGWELVSTEFTSYVDSVQMYLFFKRVKLQ